LGALREIGAGVLRADGVAPLMAALRQVNEELWEIEDAIRREEAAGMFGAEFIRLARSVYVTNDERARLKREINRLLDSELVEEKSYWQASAPALRDEAISRHAD
jgi:hypothetical protein